MAADELDRLRNGAPTSDEEEYFHSLFVVECDGNASQVLLRVKEALGIVLAHTVGPWPSISEWRNLLPEWFVEQCGPKPTEEQMNAWSEWWNSLSLEEQAERHQEEIVEGKWSLENWTAIFHPENERPWYWWEGSVVNPDTLHIEVISPDWPFATHALRWLLITSGAKDSTEH